MHTALMMLTCPHPSASPHLLTSHYSLSPSLPITLPYIIVCLYIISMYVCIRLQDGWTGTGQFDFTGLLETQLPLFLLRAPAFPTIDGISDSVVCVV